MGIEKSRKNLTFFLFRTCEVSTNCKFAWLKKHLYFSFKMLLKFHSKKGFSFSNYIQLMVFRSTLTPDHEFLHFFKCGFLYLLCRISLKKPLKLADRNSATSLKLKTLFHTLIAVRKRGVFYNVWKSNEVSKICAPLCANPPLLYISPEALFAIKLSRSTWV